MQEGKPTPQFFSGWVKNAPVKAPGGIAKSQGRAAERGVPQLQWKTKFRKKKAEPAERIASMPAEHKGPCCGGTKVWGGDSREAATTRMKGQLFYECECLLAAVNLSRNHSRSPRRLARRKGGMFSPCIDVQSSMFVSRVACTR